jgi:hypothetical protein
MYLKIGKRDNRTVFIGKGIRIEVDVYTESHEPNKLGGKYYIADATIKDVTLIPYLKKSTFPQYQ